MASDQSNNFNERLSQWVASQGIWFQMRYSMAGVGSKSALGFHLLRLATRLAIFLLVALIVLAVYLVRLPRTPAFQKKLKDAIGAGLGASEVQMGSFRRVQGKMLMASFVGKGGNDTFFSSFEARSIRCQMGLLSGLVGEWQPGVVLINQLDLALNAGTDDEKSAASIADSVFREFGSLKLETVEVKDVTLHWGNLRIGGEMLASAAKIAGSDPLHYTPRDNGGKIVGSHMKLQRVAGGWRIHLAGGTFSQAWWRRLEIVELVATCTREGVVFEKAEFRKGAGKVTMDGLRVVAGQRPEVQGTVKLRKVALADVVPPAARNFIDGAISGDLRVFGSTNTTEGIGFEGKLVVDSDNVIRLRERLYLLRALTDFDVFNNYRMVAFNEGSLKIKSQGGTLEVSDVELKAGDLMTLAGQMRVRPPTPEEASAELKRSRAGNGTGPGQIKDDTTPAKASDEDVEITLRRAARAARKDKTKAGTTAKVDEGSALVDSIDQSFETSILADQAAERESRSLIYEGLFQMTVPPDTFENVQALREFLPVDPQTGRIPLDVPIKGDIYSLTFDQAEDMYVRGRRYKE